MILDSSMAEHSAVNRRVVGSSPTRGVEKPVKYDTLQVFLCCVPDIISVIIQDGWSVSSNKKCNPCDVCSGDSQICRQGLKVNE